MNATTKPDQKKPYQAGEEDQVAERTVASKDRDARRKRGLGKILADPDCRAWLWDLLAFCGISKTSFTGNSTTFFNEGQRNVGLKIQDELVASHPDQYIAMMKENT